MRARFVRYKHPGAKSVLKSKELQTLNGGKISYSSNITYYNDIRIFAV